MKDKEILKELYARLDESLNELKQAADDADKRQIIAVTKELISMIEDVKSGNNERVVRWTTLIVDGGAKILAIAVPACIYVVCFQQGLDFEKEGVYKSFNVQNLVKRNNPNRI